MTTTIQKHLDIINELTFQRYLYIKREDSGQLFAYSNKDAGKDDKKALDTELFPTVDKNDKNGRYLIDLYDAYLIAQDINDTPTVTVSRPVPTAPILETLKHYYTIGMRYLVRQPNGFITSFQDLPEKDDSTGIWKSSTSVELNLVVPDHETLFHMINVNDDKPTQIMTILDAAETN